MIHLNTKRSCFPRGHCVGTDVLKSLITSCAYGSRNVHIKSGAQKRYEFTRTVLPNSGVKIKSVQLQSLHPADFGQLKLTLQCITSAKQQPVRHLEVQSVRCCCDNQRPRGFSPPSSKPVNLGTFNHRRLNKRRQQHLCLPWATRLQRTQPTKDSL